MYFVGIDPDLHTLGVAAVDPEGSLVLVDCIRSKGSIEREAVISMAHALRAWRLSLLQEPAAYWFERQTVGAVEAQEVTYTARQGANPRDLINLAAVAGAALAMLPDGALAFFPAPQEWKGSVPKQIHQARILSGLGWEYEKVGQDPKTGYVRPTNPPDLPGVSSLNKGDWKHVVDAIGLAYYAKRRFQEEHNRQHRLAARAGCRSPS